jgi:hypothetical protein
MDKYDLADELNKQNLSGSFSSQDVRESGAGSLLWENALDDTE